MYNSTGYLIGSNNNYITTYLRQYKSKCESPSLNLFSGSYSSTGFQVGKAKDTLFKAITDLKFNNKGELFVSDTGNRVIYKYYGGTKI